MFFIVLIGLLLRPDALELDNLVTSFMYAFLSGATCWFIGIVISDIIVKGVLTDIADPGITALLEGGLLQRVQTMREQIVPGGTELPFSEESEGTEKKVKRNPKKRKPE